MADRFRQTAILIICAFDMVPFLTKLLVHRQQSEVLTFTLSLFLSQADPTMRLNAKL